jgi:4-hydroxy 2-oxovalerate aldolase
MNFYSKKPKLLDCTLRDGGYYNSWDFSHSLINKYLSAMRAAKIDIVEIGFRFLKNEGFKGPCAFTTDEYIEDLVIPESLTIGVMINGSDLYTDLGWKDAINKLFPRDSKDSPVSLVRLACHFHEIPNAINASNLLKKKGYIVGINLMQIADKSIKELEKLTKAINKSQIDVLYFADSMGSMNKDDTSRVIKSIKKNWNGNIGIHTHDNMGQALTNTLHAHSMGVNWLDSTITGMGRGPGNARTEELVIELESIYDTKINFVPLMSIIENYFAPLKIKLGWGTNPYYYLSGKYGIHPTYIQVMLSDKRYDEEDIIGVINYLRKEGGKKFDLNNLDLASQFYYGKPGGNWAPISMINGRDVLILGAGQGIASHRKSLESYIKQKKPLVIALNVNNTIDLNLIDLNIACHPVRLLADAETHSILPQPLITPASMLPEKLKKELGKKKLLDFGIKISSDLFEFFDKSCVIPNSLVLSYALAVCVSGKMKRILLAGFDGYPNGDPRNDEVEKILRDFSKTGYKNSLISITPTRFKGLSSQSLYAL